MLDVLNDVTEILVLESLAIEIPLTELYAKVEFPAADELNVT